MSGHLLPRVTMTPFSVLNVSAGSPWMFQSRTLEGSARKPLNSKPSLEGMFSSFTCKSASAAGRGSRLQTRKLSRLQFAGIMVEV